MRFHASYGFASDRSACGALRSTPGRKTRDGVVNAVLRDVQVSQPCGGIQVAGFGARLEFVGPVLPGQGLGEPCGGTVVVG